MWCAYIHPESPRRGSAIVMVAGLSVVVALLYFSMQTFVSNRSVQIHRIVAGLSLEEAARQGVLQAQKVYAKRRPSEHSTRWSTSLNIENQAVSVFVEERKSERMRWIMNDRPGRYAMLDSLYFLATACDDNQCQTSAASEVFSPEPLLSSVGYQAFEEGLPKTSMEPVRMTAWHEAVGPAQIRQNLEEACVSMQERSCRLRLYKEIQTKRQAIRRNQFTSASLRQRVRHDWPDLGGRVAERTIQQLIRSMGVERQTERSELYWAMATLELWAKFDGPTGVSSDRLSIRAPLLDQVPNQVHKTFMQKWFPQHRFQARPAGRYKELYYHSNQTPLQHFVSEKKLESRVYRQPKSLQKSFLEERGMRLFGIRYRAQCANPPPPGLQALLSYIADIRTGNSRYIHEDCVEATVDVETVLEGEPVIESPRIYIDEKPWISLHSLYRLLKKLGGMSQGVFPEELSRKQHRQSFEPTEERQAADLMILPAYRG